MGTVDSDLDKVEEKLHDSNVLWTRAELLRLYNDGYRQLMAQSGAFSRILPLDVPGRHTYSCLYQWEDRHVTGTYWFPGLATLTATRQAMYAWEVEMLEGLTPTNSLQGITYQWERAHSGDVQAHFEFGFPKEHERVRRLAWDDKLLIPVAVREFDEVDDAWMRRVGEPTWWTTGLGRSRTVEVYEIRTDYVQGWELFAYENGIPREFSGRTYSVQVGNGFPGTSYAYATSGDADGITYYGLLSGLGWRFTKVAATASNGFCVHIWEKQQLDGTTLTASETIGTYSWEDEFGAPTIHFGVGLVRGATRPDRQYLPLVTDATVMSLLGSARDWRSTENALSALEVVIPQQDLTEDDEPALIPEQMQKYLRYYVLSRAFGREGEGQKPEMAAHYEARFKRGVALMKRLAHVAHKDRIYARDMPSESPSRPPLVRLPSEFPRAW